MKKSTRPISSPGRTEKFPPPLMRFLRSNVGSKSSRGRRSRASPMFIKKKNTVIETTQEPSSPKVTCIGQVRVRRSKKKNTTTTTGTTRTTTVRRPTNRHCGCFRKLKLKPKSCCGFWRKWVSFFRCGYCKKSKNLHDSPPVTPRSESRPAAGDNGEENEHVATVEADNQGLISRPPPKNAFLLTRCRSAPYRSSSLASKFWESTMEKTEEEEEEEEVAEKVKDLSIKEEEEEVIANGNGEINEDKCNEVEELKDIKVAPLPLILTRCKSEPARTWDQLLV